MAYAVSKPSIFKRLERLSHDTALVRRSLQDLQKRPKASLVDLGLVHGLVPKAGPDAAHLRDDWFDPSGGWWVGLGDIEKLARKALIKAGQLALRFKVPIDAYWVRGSDKIGIVVSKSEQQITIFVFSPFPPRGERVGKGAMPVARKDIWDFSLGPASKPKRGPQR